MKAIELNHPLIRHKLSILRDKNTGTKEFRELIGELAMFLCYEAVKDAKLYSTEIETPMVEIQAEKINENDYIFVPILRAGMGMVEGVLSLIPNAKIGHIGLYRNEETLEPVRYYYKIPKNMDYKEIILLDPMLATGGSISDAVKILKHEGNRSIKILSIIAAPEGIAKVERDHPDVLIYCAAIDSHLNEKGYIVPGLGDAGDRIYGTK